MRTRLFAPCLAALLLGCPSPPDSEEDAGRADAGSYDGGTVPLATQQGAPAAIALDSRYVYWVTQGASTVMRVPKSGGPVQPLASGQNIPLAVAADDAFVYWSSGGGGTLNRRPLDG